MQTFLCRWSFRDPSLAWSPKISTARPYNDTSTVKPGCIVAQFCVPSMSPHGTELLFNECRLFSTRCFQMAVGEWSVKGSTVANTDEWLTQWRMLELGEHAWNLLRKALLAAVTGGEEVPGGGRGAWTGGREGTKVNRFAHGESSPISLLTSWSWNFFFLLKSTMTTLEIFLKENTPRIPLYWWYFHTTFQLWK